MIALLSNISKVFEKADINRLKYYLDENNILDRAKNGFGSGKSVFVAATDYIGSIIDSIDKGEKTIGMSMDIF